MLGTFLVFNITTTIPLTLMIDVFAAERGGEGYKEKNDHIWIIHQKKKIVIHHR
jgi:hypothetical protein